MWSVASSHSSASEMYPVLQVGVDGGQEIVVVELQCSWDPGHCPFVISAHFLAGSAQVSQSPVS